jgi:integrase
MKSEAWQTKKLGTKPKYKWQEAAVRWLQEHRDKKSLKDDKGHLRWLDKHVHDKTLDAINKNLVETIKKDKLQSGASNATVNRVLSLLRAILRCAKEEWEWLDTVPVIKLLPEPLSRVRWLAHEEAEKLIRELPDHLAAMARFTLATGLRESNVTGLKWSQIDMKRHCAWIHAGESKSEKAIAVPLGVDAQAVIRSALGKHEVFVFTYDGGPVSRANNSAWRKALLRAGIVDFRWHDLRHTWASWHIQNGTPIEVLKELGGWSDLKMVMRYAHLSSDHLKAFGDNASKKAKSRVPVFKI